MPRSIVCQKIKYNTQTHAKENIKLIKQDIKYRGQAKSKRTKNGKMWCYHCDKCDGWHRSSIPKHIQRSIDKKYKLRAEYLRNKNGI